MRRREELGMAVFWLQYWGECDTPSIRIDTLEEKIKGKMSKFWTS